MTSSTSLEFPKSASGSNLVNPRRRLQHVSSLETDHCSSTHTASLTGRQSQHPQHIPATQLWRHFSILSRLLNAFPPRRTPYAFESGSLESMSYPWVSISFESRISGGYLLRYGMTCPCQSVTCIPLLAEDCRCCSYLNSGRSVADTCHLPTA